MASSRVPVLRLPSKGAGTPTSSDGVPVLRLPSKGAGTPMLSEGVLAGSLLRVWWRPPAGKPAAHQGEWAEVIRVERPQRGAATLRCETLGGLAFAFAPEDVARGLDTQIAKFEVQPEVALRGALRRSEVERFRRAVDETSGKVGILPAGVDTTLCGAGFLVAPSQVRVKATLLSRVESASDRQALQERLEGKLEQLADVLYVAERKQLPYQQHQQQPEAHEKHDVGRWHRPELCPHCIRKATWCSGSSHLPDATARLAQAADLLFKSGSEAGQQGPRWYGSDVGIEAEAVYEGQAVLVQLRPWHFCISETDAALFGDPASLAPLSPTATTVAWDSEDEATPDFSPASDPPVGLAEEFGATGQSDSLLSDERPEAVESPSCFLSAFVSLGKLVLRKQAAARETPLRDEEEKPPDALSFMQAWSVH